jgi:general secretion pathway protein F
MRSPVPAPRSIGRFSIVHMMLLVFCCAVLFRLALWVGLEFFMIAGVFLAIVLAVAWVIALVARRDTQQDALLWVLTIAAEQQMPLGPGIEAVADQYSGLFRRRLQALASWLSSGSSLSDALKRVPRLLPQSALVLVQVGSEIGNLSGSLREAAESRSARPLPRHPLMSKLAYLLLLLFCIQLVSAFIAFFILPKMERIYADFGVRLPELTLAAMGLSTALMDPYVLPSLLLLELLVLLYLPLFHLGWVSVPLPLADRLVRRRHAGVVLRSLALVVEAGLPMTKGIAILSREYPVWWIRARLMRVRQRLDDGADWCECLCSQGLIGPAEAALLESAQRAGNLTWALREIAESGERRLTYRLLAWTQALFPVVILSMGALVVLFALAYFGPLIRIIEELGEL